MEKYKKHIKYIGHILVIISVYLLLQILWENFSKLEPITFSWPNTLTGLFLVGIGLLGYVLFSFAWVVLVNKKYPEFKFKTAFRITALTQIAKYLPGNVAHFIGRIYLAKTHLKKADIAYSVFVEILMFSLASLSVGVCYLLYYDASKLISGKHLSLIVLAGILGGTLVFFFLDKIREKIEILQNKVITLFQVYIIFFGMSLLGGLSIYILTGLVVNHYETPYFLCVSGFALSFLIGFLVPGAPGGVGIREYTFTLLFSPFLGAIFALQVILLFRVISILTDLLMFLIGKAMPPPKETIQIHD